MPEPGLGRGLIRLIDELVSAPPPWLAHRRDPAVLLRRLCSCFGMWTVG